MPSCPGLGLAAARPGDLACIGHCAHAVDVERSTEERTKKIDDALQTHEELARRIPILTPGGSMVLRTPNTDGTNTMTSPM